MKRNVILSTVAATVVASVLMMSGCNSSSPVAKIITPDTDVDAVAITITPVAGKLTLGTGVAVNDDAGDVTVRGGEATAKSGVDCATQPCTAEFKRACGKVEGEALNYTNSCAVKNAFDALADSGPTAVADKEFRYAGFIDVTSSYIESCKVDLVANLDCSLDRDGKVVTDPTGATGSTGAGGAGDTGPVLASDYVYINGNTAPVGSRVAIYVVPNEGCSMGSTGTWYNGEVKYHDAAKKHAYVDVDGIDITDIPARVYFFVEEFSQVDGNDVQTGATGSTGAG